MPQNFSAVRHFERQSEVVAWTSGQTVRIRIPRESWIQHMVLKFWGTITVGVEAAVALAPDTPLGGLARIRVLANGSPLTTWTGPLAYRYAQFQNDNGPGITAPAVGVGAQAFEVFVPLGPAYRRDWDETDNLIPANAYDTLEVEVTCGNPESILYPDVGTSLAVAASLQVFTRHHIPGPTGAAKQLYTEVHQRSVAAAAAEVPLYFRKHGVYLRGVLLRQISGDVAEEQLVDTVVTQIREQAGGYDLRPWQAVGTVRGLTETGTDMAIPAGYVFLRKNLEGKSNDSIRMANVGNEYVLYKTEAIPGNSNLVDILFVCQTEEPTATAVIPG
jgi:hypothetical protein